MEGLLTEHVVDLLLESITPGLQVKGKWATDRFAKKMSWGWKHNRALDFTWTPCTSTLFSEKECVNSFIWQGYLVVLLIDMFNHPTVKCLEVAFTNALVIYTEKQATPPL